MSLLLAKLAFGCAGRWQEASATLETGTAASLRHARERHGFVRTRAPHSALGPVLICLEIPVFGSVPPAAPGKSSEMLA